MKCNNCNQNGNVSKGRAFDGRRAYRCNNCGNVWTNGMQNRVKQYSSQRESYQFADSKLVEQKINSLQQLKAEIAAIVEDVEFTMGLDGCDFQDTLSDLVSKLRQLSAVFKSYNQ